MPLLKAVGKYKAHLRVRRTKKYGLGVYLGTGWSLKRGTVILEYKGKLRQSVDDDSDSEYLCIGDGSVQPDYHNTKTVYFKFKGHK